MSEPEIPNVAGLDPEAWTRWIAYRIAIKKPIKPISIHLAATRLSRYGKDQAAVVDRSISNGWTGLFDLDRPSKPEKGARVEIDTSKSAAELVELNARNERAWSKSLSEPMGKLLLADALLARYLVDQEHPAFVERIEDLRERVAGLLRESDQKVAGGDPRITSMVMYLFGEKGWRRLRERAAA